MMLLGVRVDPVTNDEAAARIASFLDEPIQRFVTTPNPEIILYAHKHPDYREILNRADLALPDGIGLKLVSKQIKERVSGADTVPRILSAARERGLRVALLGGRDETTLDKAAAIIKEQGSDVVYATHGVTREHWNDRSFHEKIIYELRATRPELVLVGFGHPKQEEWIDAYRSQLPTVRLFVGCGGTLDFIAGASVRAPQWMRRAGLEWLWRLVREPKRFKRIINAVIVFPLTVLYASLRKQ